MEVTDAWYIDAWAVRDGVAFASRRPEGTIDATNTVFLSVPALEPIPVGRISTALRATRACFQEGLLDENEREVPFETLAQVRELVRRAYLAGGIGPTGTAAPVQVGLPPVPSEGGGAYYEHAEAVRSWGHFEWYRPNLGPVRSIEELAKAARGGLSWLRELVRAFARATVVEWEQALLSAEPYESDRHELARWHRGLQEWYELLVSLGVWAGHNDLTTFLETFPSKVGQELLGSYSYSLLQILSRSFDRHYTDQELVAMAPCPLRSNWDPRIARLSDKLFLALSTGDYFLGNRGLAELVPALLAAASGVPESDSVRHGVEDDARLDARVLDGLRWLQHQVPSVGLPEVAEAMLTAYAWSQLGPEPPEATPPQRVPEPPIPSGSGPGRAMPIPRATPRPTWQQTPQPLTQQKPHLPLRHP